MHPPHVTGVLAGMMGLLLLGAPAQAGVTQASPTAANSTAANSTAANSTAANPAVASATEASPTEATSTEARAAQSGAVQSGAAQSRAAQSRAVGREAPQDPAVERPRVETATPQTAAVDEARREALLRVSSRGARVRVGGDVTIGEHERIGEVVTLFGQTEIRGIVTGDLFALGGDVRLGPTALVRGDILTIGGVVRAETGAYVGGKISEVSLSTSDFRLWLPDDGGEVTIAFQPDWPRIARVVFVSGIMGVLFCFVICAVLLAIAPGAVGRARQQASASPVASLAVGFAAEILFLPVIAFLAVVLSLSIIGVPLLALLPILALFFALALAIGFTSIASGLGARLVGRATPIAALLLGLILIWGTGMIGRYVWTMDNGRFGWGIVLLVIGTGIELVVCTLGLGATLLSWSANRRRTRAAPAPPAPVVTEVDPLPQGL